MAFTFSIIVPAFNEENIIINLFEAIASLNADRFTYQLIVVDNGSTDGTVAIAEEFADEIYQLPGLKISELRNFGAKKAIGRYLVFFDADCVPCRDWLVSAKEILEREPNAGVIGGFYDHAPEPTWVEKLWWEVRKNEQEYVNFLPAGNCAVRRGEFLKIGGFASNLQTGEDYDLCLRYRKKGMQIKNSPLLKTVHYGNSKTLTEILRREVWYGQGMWQTFISGGLSKPLIASAIILVGIALIMASLFTEFINHVFSYKIFFSGIAAILFPPTIYAAYATIKTHKIGYFPLYFLIYSSYLSGRIISIYYIICSKTKRLK